MDQTRPGLPVILPELLAPGGSLEKCRIALLYGADAVYLAGKDFGLRGYAHNLDTEELAQAVFLAHLHGKKVYVTVNVFARQADLDRLPDYLRYLRELGADALIVSDPGVLLLAGKYAAGIPIHLSTQANTTNSMSLKFWRDQGISRINLARELSFTEVADIAEAAAGEQIELEVFVHGSMCMSYSGRCLISAYLNRRSANSGYCTQPCRWSYSLVEEKRPGEYFPVMEDARGTYIFNSRDLCLIEHIGRLAALGIRSFKIEGRMKGALYLASVTRAYRQAIDGCSRGWDNYRVDASWMRDLLEISHRPYTNGFLFEDPSVPDASIETGISYLQSHTLAGIVREFPDRDSSGKVCLEARSRLKIGQKLEFLFPDGSSRYQVLDHFADVCGNKLMEAHPNKWITFSAEFPVLKQQVVRTPGAPNGQAGIS
ncbi:MAG: U32 family peptidase [Syntrophobacter sp.]